MRKRNHDAIWIVRLKRATVSVSRLRHSDIQREKPIVPLKSVTAADSVLGYTLKERIGSGGYGEVWAAEAPGGLQKAIKFIYGYHDEDRATRELKSLNRIKEVRHPFLLSLERIEVVDGQLVVITELADHSLKDRYDECRERGPSGDSP